MAFGHKDYVDALKFRAVMDQYFYPELRTAAERKEYLDAGGVIEDAMFLFPDPPTKSDAQLIEAALTWVFAPGRTIRPARFNDHTFPALYTAKEMVTAERELAYWSRTGLEYTIFSIFFTGKAQDLRPSVDAGLFAVPLQHDPCQRVGAEARKDADAIVSYSFRNRGGSCCTIFSSHGLRAGSITHRGIT